jgi:hypothetical protein
MTLMACDIAVAASRRVDPDPEIWVRVSRQISSRSGHSSSCLTKSTIYPFAIGFDTMRPKLNFLKNRV